MRLWWRLAFFLPFFAHFACTFGCRVSLLPWWASTLTLDWDAGARLWGMTTREKAHRLLDELPESEVEPVVEFIVSRGKSDPGLEALLDEEADELLGELDAGEREAGSRRPA